MTLETIDIKHTVTEGVARSQTVFTTSEGHEMDRSKTVSASSWTRCERAQRFSKDKTPHDPGHVENWGWAEAGNAYEDWVVRKIISGLPHGVYLEAAGEHQRTLVDAEARLSATPDGLLVSRANGPVHVHGVELLPGSENGVGVEIKSRGPNAAALPKPEHVHQAELQIELWNKVAKVEVGAVLLVYANRDRYDEMDVFVVPRRPESWSMAVGVAFRVFGSHDPMSIAPEGRATGECRYCPWKSRCNTGELQVPVRKEPELGPEQSEALKTALQKRELAAHQATTAAKAKLEAEHEVRQLLRDANTAVAKVGGANVTLSRVKGRTTLDQAALEAAGIDLEPYRKTGEPGVRLSIRGRV